MCPALHTVALTWRHLAAAATKAFDALASTFARFAGALLITGDVGAEIRCNRAVLASVIVTADTLAFITGPMAAAVVTTAIARCNLAMRARVALEAHASPTSARPLGLADHHIARVRRDLAGRTGVEIRAPTSSVHPRLVRIRHAHAVRAAFHGHAWVRWHLARGTGEFLGADAESMQVAGPVCSTVYPDANSWYVGTVKAGVAISAHTGAIRTCTIAAAVDAGA